MTGIYQIRNTRNSKVYVGSAVDMIKRGRTHRLRLSANRHPNRHLQAAWNKYGERAFRFSVLEECDADALLRAEQQWIDQTKAIESAHGYNQRKIAASNAGMRSSDETRAKLSAARRGNQNAKGTKQSADTIAKRSASLRARWAVTPKKRGPKWTAERREHMRRVLRGKPGYRGSRSQEFKDKVSASVRAMWAEKRAAL